MPVIEPDGIALASDLAELERRRHSEDVQIGLRVVAKRGFTYYPERPTATGKSPSWTAVSNAISWSRILTPWGRRRRIFDICLQGATERDIVEQLNEGGIPSPSGHRWTIGEVRRILSTEVYCGTSVANRRAMRNPETAVRVPNAFPAIISQDEFDQVQSMRGTVNS